MVNEDKLAEATFDESDPVFDTSMAVLQYAIAAAAVIAAILLANVH